MSPAEIAAHVYTSECVERRCAICLEREEIDHCSWCDGSGKVEWGCETCPECRGDTVVRFVDTVARELSHDELVELASSLQPGDWPGYLSHADDFLP